MARHPAPGRVKTRLAASIGTEAACALYEAFVLDLAERLAGQPFPVRWAYAPADAPFPALLPGARCEPQVGGDLGARMAHAIAVTCAERPGPVLVLGADMPHVPLASLTEAARALADGHDLVLGPSTDGGYHLIGLTRPVPELFVDVAWGTDGVLAGTLARAHRLGLRTHRLLEGFDVDELADLVRLEDLVTRRAVTLPRTSAALRTYRRPSP